MAFGNKLLIGLIVAFGLGLALAWHGSWWPAAILCGPGVLAVVIYLNLEAILDRIADTIKGVKLW